MQTDREARPNGTRERDPLQERANQIAKADFAEDANKDLQRVYSGLMTVEKFEERYG